ncbi:histidine kinase [Pilimelia terevasa]|uniref:histidine kinase n=1 Tax=Pilimelia terevasa TaxID=53372 RepID=A0A8J3BVL5_9ACTN|nr:PAS domain S-box protein [Pilimelia terevasa]GGK39893.1 histidine kinase [Pilimelia terevasa]
MSDPIDADVAAAIVRSAHDAVVATDNHLRVVAFNAAAERMLGYPADEVLGRCVDDLLPEPRRTDYRELMAIIAAGGAVERYQTERRHRDGHLVPVWMTVSPLRDGGGALVGMTTIARRVSERERAEASLQAMLEAAPDAMIGVDAAGRVVLANTQAEVLFALTRHKLIGAAIGDLLSDDLPSPGSPAGPDAHHPEGEPTFAVGIEGRRIPVEITVSVLTSDLGPVRCAVIRDITDRLRARAAFLRLRAESERARMEAALQRTQRLESLGQLAGGVAHDFNNLIAVIASYADFIVEEATAVGLASAARDADQIRRAARRGADLTRQLLAFARREVVRPRVLDLNEVIAEVEHMLRRSIGEHIALVTRPAPGIPPVTADAGQLQQVLVNLAVNARDAMPGGGSLIIETSATALETADIGGRPHLRPGRFARLRVSDTGAGMPPEVIQRAFEPFYTTKPSGEGTGLGLAMVYGILTSGGGDVTLYSELGMGTTVTMLLPASDGTPEPPETPASAADLQGHGETVLVVEDEGALREVLERTLGTAGYKVLVAENGAAALDLSDRYPEHIDLLLTDVVMPKMPGRELAGRVTTARPATLVLYTSGYAQPVLHAHQTLEPGVVLLEKPFTKAELLTAVRRRLASAPRAGGGRPGGAAG